MYRMWACATFSPFSRSPSTAAAIGPNVEPQPRTNTLASLLGSSTIKSGTVIPATFAARARTIKS
ncbi:unannotated protein [freshwater metagenome]|uniref:Unannotated protein n=1 Tax=freshwater metagenome TaxID=449393 RepID=A0A6J6GTS7_9ZZZZ